VRIPLLHNSCFNVALALVVSAADSYASARGQRWGDGLATIMFAGYGIYCVQNFLGCREVHCAITGPGFLLAAILMLLQMVGVRDGGFGLPWMVFVAAFIIGYGVEYFYKARTGTTFVPRSH